MTAVTRRSGPEVAIADVVTFIPNGPHSRSRRGRDCQKAGRQVGPRAGQDRHGLDVADRYRQAHRPGGERQAAPSTWASTGITVAIIAITVAIIVRSTAPAENGSPFSVTEAARITAVEGDGLCHRLESYFSSSWSFSCLVASAAASAATDTVTVTAASVLLVLS
jgi:hypothetical protein